MEYQDFLMSKSRVTPTVGLSLIPETNEKMFDWQSDIVRWALRRGRCCIFANCGLGKTLLQLEWARCIPGNVLILAPLAVAQQTAAEAAKFGIDCTVGVSRNGRPAGKITITNYEMLDKFDAAEYAGVVLDESSIIKSFSGKIRTQILATFRDTPYRLACTATPAPNDVMELCNHAEFVGVMSRPEMLATFFCHDGGDTSEWRLKGHAVEPFWRWVASWAIMVRNPADIGYDGMGFELPDLRIVEHALETGIRADDTMLFTTAVSGLGEQRKMRRKTLDTRVARVAELVNGNDDTWIIWCELNDESKAITAAIPGAVEVEGSMSYEAKETALMAFVRGEVRVLVTKPKLAGFGLNLQHCHRMAYVGLSYSYEAFYQSLRRCWRYGQTKTVEANVVVTDVEREVIDTIKRKQADHEKMVVEMGKHMRDTILMNLSGMTRDTCDYVEDVASGDGWTLHLGDCVEVAKRIPDNSIDYSIFSPPFASLYTYSASDRDMGNCGNPNVFMEHYSYLVAEQYRITKPGRLLSFHCMNLPMLKQVDGEIGLKDFRGWLIDLYVRSGFIFHSEVCIWKDPVTAMQRTKAIGLLWKQLRKNSSLSRMGLPDYLVTMRKPGTNEEFIEHTAEDYPVEKWQQIASPIWSDIDPSDTLQHRSARENCDERHICPLQLTVIRRAVELWSNPGDLVMSPFAGIASEGYVSLQMKRRFIGIELKRSYWEQGFQNLQNANVQLSLPGV
jgi:superfamily II DNA or RNA helicase